MDASTPPPAPAGRPRVSFVVDSDAWGGAEVWAASHVRRAAANGWAASVVCARPVADRLRQTLPLDALPASALRVVDLARHAGTAPGIAAALADQRPDVVHVNLVDPGSNAAAVRAGASVAPTTGTLHLHGDCGRTPGRRRELVELYAGFAALVTPATAIRAQIVDVLRAPAERVTVVPNGVDVPAVAPGPLGGWLNGAPLVVGSFGRLTEQKGYDILIEAASRLLDEGLAFRLVIGGAGRDLDKLAAQAVDLPVSFPGFISDAAAFLAGVDVFVLPSRREALPLVLLEAMAAGLPCVSTDVGDVTLRVGDAVVVVPVEDTAALTSALRRVLTDRPLRVDLGRRARAAAERDLGADLMARRTFAVLHGVLRR